MPKLRNPTNQSSSSIQNRLQLINMRQRYTSVNCTTIIHSSTDKRMHEGPGSFKGQRAAYRTNLPQMGKTRATYTAHMPGKGQFLVQGYPQVPHSSGKQDTREAFQQDGKINFGQLHTATNPDELCLPRVQPKAVRGQPSANNIRNQEHFSHQRDSLRSHTMNVCLSVISVLVCRNPQR